MGLFVVRHRFAEPVEENEASARQLLEVNREFGVDWVRSYYATNGTEALCVYKAPDAETLREHARCLGMPVEDVLAVSEVLPPRGL